MRFRRAFIAAAALLALAGCASGRPGGPPTVTRTTTNAGDGMKTEAGDLDLREANVVEVSVEVEPGGDVRFEVTLYHDDGVDGYANWWQVETPDGTRLGRRELLHAHSTAPFTRSTTVAVPPDVTCGVVRGHDQTHGYGGQAMLVNLETGASRAVEQGSDAERYEAGDCP